MSSQTTTSLNASPEPASGPVALAGAPRPAGAPKSKPRKRVNTAEKRHQHNAIERQRRETLNSKFLVLARILPSLAACRRPSKSAIVNGSISHLNYQRSQRQLASKLLRQLSAERDELFREVNEWRVANGFPAKAGLANSWSDEMEEVCGVDKETFGSFANVDDGCDDGGDDDEVSNSNESCLSADPMNLERAAMVAGSFGTGLITPRSSADMGSGLSSSLLHFGAAANKNAPAVSWTGYQMPASVQFNAFVGGDAGVDTSSTGSPVGSSHNSAILTPPSMDSFAHNPSPGSTASDEPRSASAATTPAPAQWTPQQLAFLQQQMQVQNMQQRQQAGFTAPLAQGQQPQQSQDNMALNGLFLNQQGQTTNANNVPQQNGLAQLMASMFPQQGDLAPTNPEQIDQWRKLAIGGLLAQQQHGHHHGQQQQTLGFGWNEPVKGF